MERIAIFAALQWECAPVLRHMRQVRRERLGDFTLWRSTQDDREIWLMKTGMGMHQAQTAAQAMTDAGSFAVFCSTGCAGALAPDMIPGDLAVATEVIGDPSGQRFATHLDHCERARSAAQRLGLRATAGQVLCSPHALTTAMSKRAAAAAGSIAVEMEGAPIAARAAAAGIPFISVRAILDTADMELPHAGKFIEPRTGTIKPLALASYLLTHPRALPGLMGMQRMRNAAQLSLERFFGAWLGNNS